MNFGVSSMTTPLRTVALRRPSQSLINADATQWHYGPTFNPSQVDSVHQERQKVQC